MGAATSTHQEQRRTAGHYRTLANGKVVYVHDFTSTHAIANQSREALLHERSALDMNRNAIRVSNAADLRALAEAARREGVTFRIRRAGANHHGRRGAYDHMDFENLEAAEKVLEHASLAHLGRRPPIETEGTAANAPRRPRRPSPQADPGPQHGTDRGPDTDAVQAQAPAPARRPAATPPAPVAPREVDDQFERIFGQRLESPKPDESEIGQQFASIFGKLPEIAGENHELSQSDAARIRQEGGFSEVLIGRDAINMWNQYVKVDPVKYIVDIYKEFGPGGRLVISGGGNGMRIQYNNVGTEITRDYMGLGTTDATVSHSYFQVDRNHRGEDKGKALFRASLEFYEKIGLKKITVHANIDVGSYAWARYRFKPNNGQQLLVIQNAVKRSHHFPALKARIPELAQAVDSTSMEAAWIIADVLSKEIREGRIPRGENPMLNLHWYGHIDLKNDRQMKAVRKYVGAKQ